MSLRLASFQRVDKETHWCVSRGHFFQDHLVFALGQFSIWEALSSLHLPELHLLVARIYLILGHLQVKDTAIFYRTRIFSLFRDSPRYLQERAAEEKARIDVDPFVEPERVKPVLAEHFSLSPTEQEEYLRRFPKAWYERSKER
jgi:hypothetical protein